MSSTAIIWKLCLARAPRPCGALRRRAPAGFPVVTGRITCEGKRRLHSFLDTPLVVEVRDARPLVQLDPTDVDVVFDAGFTRQHRKTLALRLFPLDACLPAFFSQRKMPQVPANAGRSVASSSRSPLTMWIPWRAGAAAYSLAGLARQAAADGTCALQALRDRAALIAGHPGADRRIVRLSGHG